MQTHLTACFLIRADTGSTSNLQENLQCSGLVLSGQSHPAVLFHRWSWAQPWPAWTQGSPWRLTWATWPVYHRPLERKWGQGAEGRECTHSPSVWALTDWSLVLLQKLRPKLLLFPNSLLLQTVISFADLLLSKYFKRLGQLESSSLLQRSEQRAACSVFPYGIEDIQENHVEKIHNNIIISGQDSMSILWRRSFVDAYDFVIFTQDSHKAKQF